MKEPTDARNREKMLQTLNPCSIFIYIFFSYCDLPQISVKCGTTSGIVSAQCDIPTVRVYPRVLSSRRGETIGGYARRCTHSTELQPGRRRCSLLTTQALGPIWHPGTCGAVLEMHELKHCGRSRKKH